MNLINQVEFSAYTVNLHGVFAFVLGVCLYMDNSKMQEFCLDYVRGAAPLKSLLHIIQLLIHHTGTEVIVPHDQQF